MRYELYYWPGIPGRGEFIRLALEDAGAEYVDVSRHGGDRANAEINRFLKGRATRTPPFAPPFLKAGNLVVSHVANILQFLGPRLSLIPRSQSARLWALALQLTIADLTAEVHDTHHPLGPDLYYEDQQVMAIARAKAFLETRLPKYLGYFENVLLANHNSDDHLIDNHHSYPDISLFHVVAGLRYAFPNAIQALEPDLPRVHSLAHRVSERPRVVAYLKSQRHLSFNQQGIFRHYPELDYR